MIVMTMLLLDYNENGSKKDEEIITLNTILSQFTIKSVYYRSLLFPITVPTAHNVLRIFASMIPTIVGLD